MDYLDPQKKKLKRTRLMIGYGLLGIAISIATVIAVYLVNGYYIDRETGEVIQNGLIYVDSKPESAQIYLNGQQQRGSTDARLVVPEGKYKIELKREGYRNWSNDFMLEGGSLRRLSYARLVPEILETELAINLPARPTMSTQSPDKRWLVMAYTDSPLLMRTIDLDKKPFEFTNLQLPADTLATRLPGTWKTIDWADDNKTFLAEYRTEKTVEYVLIDRDNPNKSKKIKTAFPGVAFSSVTIRDRKNDLVYLFNSKTGKLLAGNATNAQTETVLSDVIDYVTFGKDSLLYVTSEGATKNHVKVKLKIGKDEIYDIREIQKADKYLLALSKLGNHIVMGVGSQSEGRVIVYDDPIAALKQNDFSSIPVPTTVMSIKNPEELSISTDSGVIITRGGQFFASHEFENDRSYSFKSSEPIDKNQHLRWVDDKHIVVSSEGKQLLLDYDGNNQYELSVSTPLIGAYFDRSYNFLYTYQEPASKNQPPKLMLTFMRSLEDR